MTDREAVTEAEQRLAVERLAALLTPKGYNILILGSVAVLSGRKQASMLFLVMREFEELLR